MCTCSNHWPAFLRRGSERDRRQNRDIEWVRSTFGEATLAVDERAARFLEEALELAQAVGLTREKAIALVEYVYSRPVGDPAQEVGGVGVTLLGLCSVIGVSADREERREHDRVTSIDPAKFRARHAKKVEAGIATPSDAAA